MLCLDTNIVISVINERPASIRTRLEAELASGVTIGIPAIVLFEMRYGAAIGGRAARLGSKLSCRWPSHRGLSRPKMPYPRQT